MPGQAGSVLVSSFEEYHRLCLQTDLVQSDHPQAIVSPAKYPLPEGSNLDASQLHALRFLNEGDAYDSHAY
eukprot:3367357-Amphidinium_carterae.2